MTILNFVKQTDEQLAELGLSLHEQYMNAEPYPHIVVDDFFCPDAMDEILAQTPSLAKAREGVEKMSNRNEQKYATVGERQFGETTKQFARFLNSEPFLRFLEGLTGINNLLPDPHFEGGGHHEILPGGFLKIHADFGKNTRTGLDRRLNALVYLNKDWKEEYGGHFELWDVEMKGCVKKVLPLFNR
ncbi:MAG: 2OG-Fe(II) oxygenase [Planctomycetota bacterium]